MRLMRRIIMGAVVMGAATGIGLPQTAPAPDMTAAIQRLTSTLERCATLIEKDLSLRASDNENAKVELAVGILGLRYRKIDRMEAEIVRTQREEEDAGEAIQLVKAQLEAMEAELGAAGQSPEGVKGALAAVEARVKMGEDRLARLTNNRLVLESDLTLELRRLEDLEAVIDGWLGTLR